MVDIQFIRDNPDKVKQNAANKNVEVDIDELLRKDVSRLDLLRQVESIRQERNELTATAKGTKPSSEQIAKGKALKDKLSMLEVELETIEAGFKSLYEKVPNTALDDVPVGTSEEQNVVSKTVGDTTLFSFHPRSHAEIAEAKGWLDKERAAKVAGARFAYVKGDLVRLQMAIVQFVMDSLSSEEVIKEIVTNNNLSVSTKPFLPILPPLLIRTELYQAMDRLEPRDDRYKIDGEELWLQGSAEHVLGSMHADETFDEQNLPIRYLGYATSFRKEAGTYGKDMEGMFRMHQFDKLEMESFTLAENGLEEHHFMVAIQEYLMGKLKIPYHVLLKCTADIGKPNARGIDIEAWLPGQNKYRETHTADYMTDYQARRLNTRVRVRRQKDDGAVTVTSELIHTNDATAFALSRTPIAIIENYQTEEGDVVIPEVLRPYMGNREKI